MAQTRPAELPSAVPLLLFVAGLSLARVLLDPWLAAGATMFCAVLLYRLTGNARVVLLISFLAMGFVSGARARSAHSSQTAVAASTDKFTTIEMPIDGPWVRTSTGFRLSAPKFRVGGQLIHAPVAIYLAAPPLPMKDHARVIVRGFLRRNEGGRFALVCKSPRLIRYQGAASRWHPRSWNRRATEKLSEITTERPDLAREVALAVALALGRSDELSPEIREDYRRGGTYHLLVFSGMQIALAAAALSFFFRGRGSLRRLDAALFLLSLVAPLFAGNEPSVTRASLMIGIFAGSRLLARPTSLENLFFVSALIRLWMAPHEITDAGFALTYAATGGLLFIGHPLARLARHRITAGLLYGLGAEVATVPLTLMFFHQMVIGGSVVTILLAPVLAFMLGLAALASLLVFLSADAACAVLHLLGNADALATAINHLFGSTLRLSRIAMAPPVMLVACCYFAATVLIACRRFVFTPAVLMLLPLAYGFVATQLAREVSSPMIEVLDVGQGDAILLRSGRDAILVDGGGRREDPEFARRVLLPKLADRGIGRLSVVLLTHPHPDHCNNLPPVFEHFAVGEFWISPVHLRESCANTLANLAFRKGIAVHLVRTGDRRRIGEFTIDLFASRRYFKRARLNNTSVVALATAQRRTILLTGDVEKEAEAALTSVLKPVDVLKVAHHGSRHSTTSEFLAAIRPRVAVISCARRNPFGHPHPLVLARLRETSARVLRTDANNDIRIIIREQHIYVTSQIDTPRGEP